MWNLCLLSRCLWWILLFCSKSVILIWWVLKICVMICLIWSIGLIRFVLLLVVSWVLSKVDMSVKVVIILWSLSVVRWLMWILFSLCWLSLCWLSWCWIWFSSSRSVLVFFFGDDEKVCLDFFEFKMWVYKVCVNEGGNLNVLSLG